MVYVKDIIIRKEVYLTPDIVKILQREADKKQWSLKKYMESVLQKHAESKGK